MEKLNLDEIIKTPHCINDLRDAKIGTIVAAGGRYFEVIEKDLNSEPCDDCCFSKCKVPCINGAKCEREGILNEEGNGGEDVIFKEISTFDMEKINLDKILNKYADTFRNTKIGDVVHVGDRFFEVLKEDFNKTAVCDDCIFKNCEFHCFRICRASLRCDKTEAFYKEVSMFNNITKIGELVNIKDKPCIVLNND